MSQNKIIPEKISKVILSDIKTGLFTKREQSFYQFKFLKYILYYWGIANSFKKIIEWNLAEFKFVIFKYFELFSQMFCINFGTILGVHSFHSNSKLICYRHRWNLSFIKKPDQSLSRFLHLTRLSFLSRKQ